MTNKIPAREKKKFDETDVILVVKGAGEQEDDVHLNLFLRGFWPAIKSLDPRATIEQMEDGTSDGISSPHEENGHAHKHLTEIQAKLNGIRKRIWVKESYWEDEVLPSTTLGNLSKEWKLSSHVFVNMFQDIFFTRDSKRVRDKRRTPQLTDYPQPDFGNFIANWASYFMLFLFLLVPLGLALILKDLNPKLGESAFRSALISIIHPAVIPNMGWLNGVYGFLFTLIIAIVWSVAPASEIYVMTYYRSKRELSDLPGLPAWTLVLLILLLLSNPIGYMGVLFLLLIFQSGLLIARRVLWMKRAYVNTDVDHSTYYPYRLEGKGWPVGKIQEWGITRLAFSPLIYRYFVFLALPLAFVLTMLADIFVWTKVLGDLGKAIDKFVKFLLVGYLDDVVNYATDPAQAHRVRSVIMKDIKIFHDYMDGEGVQHIHVVAHSQGTPITFEALFHYLEPKYQEKVLTFITLGSILSYYYQARGILNLMYYNRFKMPIRKDNFQKGFKWLNFWNFTDPITEFYGLDEYTWFEDVRGKERKKNSIIPKRGSTGPTNIRTRSSLIKNHGEYWDNLDNFQIPFAKRVLGQVRPREWNKEKITPWKLHHFLTLLLWFVTVGIIVVGLYAAYVLVWKGLLWEPINQFIKSWDSVQTLLFPPKEGADPDFLKKLIASLQDSWSKFLIPSMLILAMWAIIDWGAQLRRAVLLWLKQKPLDEK